MQTQRDHVQAYAFQVGRLSSALLTGEASFLEPPARRAKLGTAVGVGLTVLILVGFFLFGLIRQQSGTSGGSSSSTSPTVSATATPPTTAPTPSTTASSPVHRKAERDDAGGSGSHVASGPTAAGNRGATGGSGPESARSTTGAQ
ncbi:type VII secretion protein EccB [Kineosporia sp. J2-2]|uniref:Type VII secretion protein EccB n=1 Tax=Kineosporia corallincola TaxID=2835133 RepID=A0ABS5TP16_9ACTN|nr:type VII secretion protein EccB [Kineosporia corallincola]MBT0772848.1 type VII secretion protein EccB [Kineosporia corallincola]